MNKPNKRLKKILSRLDVAALNKYMRAYNMPHPNIWAPGARLIMMHKLRLHFDGFSEEQRAESTKWLTDNGCALDINAENILYG